MIVTVQLTDIVETSLAGERLLLTLRDGEGITLDLDRPRLLRAEMAAWHVTCERRAYERPPSKRLHAPTRRAGRRVEAQAAPKAPARRRDFRSRRPDARRPRSALDARRPRTQYVAARDAWIAAMRRPTAAAPPTSPAWRSRRRPTRQAMVEVETVAFRRARLRSRSSPRRSARPRRGVGQELAWRRVHERLVHDDQDKPPGPLARALRRFTAPRLTSGFSRSDSAGPPPRGSGRRACAARC